MDPFGPRRLRDWLLSKCSELPEPPAFVAVEYNHENLVSIQRQKAGYEEFFKNKQSESAVRLIERMIRVIGYEAEVPMALFPKKILWLEDKRDVPSEFVENEVRKYSLYFQDHSPTGNDDNDLMPLSEETWAHYDAAPSQPSDGERDERFARKVIEAARSSQASCGIIAVGASHTRSANGRMRSILESNNLECSVELLRS